jgi:hypothetical protein
MAPASSLHRSVIVVGLDEKQVPGLKCIYCHMKPTLSGVYYHAANCPQAIIDDLANEINRLRNLFREIERISTRAAHGDAPWEKKGK